MVKATKHLEIEEFKSVSTNSDENLIKINESVEILFNYLFTHFNITMDEFAEYKLIRKFNYESTSFSKHLFKFIIKENKMNEVDFNQNDNSEIDYNIDYESNQDNMVSEFMSKQISSTSQNYHIEIKNSNNISPILELTENNSQQSILNSAKKNLNLHYHLFEYSDLN